MDGHEKQNNAPYMLFYSYVDEDEDLRNQLEKHLSLLRQQRMIVEWHHHKILPGAEKNYVSDERLSSADIILLLISPSFLASDVAYAEMQRALQLQKSGRAQVIPILLRPVENWQGTPFGKLQALPSNGTPITQWRNRDLAFVDIVKRIRAVLEQSDGPHHQVLPPVLFLSSARKDLPLIKRLKDDLHAHGLLGLIDDRAFQSGSSEKEDLREVIRNASAVVLVASPHTRRSRLVQEELHIADMYLRSIYVFWTQGNLLTEVIPTGWSHLRFFDARAERYTQAFQDLLQTTRAQTSSFSPIVLDDEYSPPLKDPRNPFKGLQAFRAEDARDFFGRDRLIDELLEEIQQLLRVPPSDIIVPRVLTVLGSSGSGKSSVVMAGLLPQLKQGMFPDSRDWIYLDPITPGKHPIEALVLALAPLFPERSFKSIREDLEDDSARGLHLLLASYTKQSGTSVLLVVDQFEELFTQTDTEIERQHFLDILLTATTEPSGPVLAILTLRADFYDRPLQYPNLGHLIEHHHVTVYPMEMRNLRAVIEQPVRLPDVQLTFEEDLVGDLLFDVQGQVGALPLLQFTLEQLFYHRKERLLTIDAYCKIGGIKGAIANHAELTFQSLPTQTHQRLARALFLRLINPGATDQDASKRRILNSELVVIDPEETAKLAEVKNAFLNARLLTSNTVGEMPTIEVSHEALIRAWPRLEQWLHEAYEDIRLQQTISRDAAEWQRRGQSVDRLYRGSQLKEALKWRETNLPSRDEDSFLQASIDECQRVQRFERQQKQSYTRRMVMIGAVGVVGIAGTIFFARKIYENVFSPPVLPVKSLPYIYSGHSKAVNSVAWSPDGKQIASASNDQTVQVWDANNGSPLLTYRGHSNVVNSVAWTSDGERIASGSNDATAQVWDANNGSRIFTYRGHTGGVYSVAWSPDGKRIASGSNGITVQVWSVSNGTLRFTYKGHTSSVNSVAWSPDGKRIASAGGDQTVQVWNAPAN